LYYLELINSIYIKLILIKINRNNNNIVSPIKFVNNNNQSDEGWTIQQKQKSKRNHSSSSNSTPNSPSERQPKPRKKIFASANRFEVFASNEDQDSNQIDGLNDNPLNDTAKNTAIQSKRQIVKPLN